LSHRSYRADRRRPTLIVFGRTSDHLEMAVTYNTEIFSADRVQQCAARLRDTLEAIVDDRPVRDILTQARPA
jgi:hypothetical protein